MSYISRAFVARRAYSSFFSSKAGGGRYFNSSKPPKPVNGGVHKANNPDSSSTTKAESSTSDPPQSEDSSSSSLNLKEHSSHIVSPPPASASSSSTAAAATTPKAGTTTTPLPTVSHPSISLNDLRLFQFFSAHGPLTLWTNNPYRSSPNWDGPTIFEQQQTTTEPSQSSSLDFQTIGNPNMLAVDDEHVARQLNRAISINRAGSAVAWEDVLRRLGLDVSQDPSRVEAHRQLANDLQEIHMDSVKRKRRKKMKKHKLKKRRKATRSQRLRLKMG